MVLNKWLSPASGTSSTHSTEGIKARGKPRARLSFAPEMEMKSALPILLLLLVALIYNQVDAAAASSRSSSQSENEFAVEASNAARKHKHHLLLFLGGLKSVAAVILIKIKIVLVVAAIIAVSMFTVKYLMGATALPDLPFLHNKANLVPQPLPPPTGLAHHYLPVEHEPVYGTHEYSTPTTWEYSSHDNYGNEWSKIGNGGRSLLDFASYLDLDKISSKNAFNLKRKKIRRRR